VPHLVDEELGDVRIGELEGASLDAYRAAPAHSNRKVRFPGGESLDEAALRYAAAFGRLLARGEQATLVVCHEIPLRYLANAAAGSDELNGPLTYVANAAPYLFDETSLSRVVGRIQELAG
ncbi:MAG TPA: histidine phosphatase family protein, partial [Gaiellaceae bacterium]